MHFSLSGAQPANAEELLDSIFPLKSAQFHIPITLDYCIFEFRETDACNFAADRMGSENKCHRRGGNATFFFSPSVFALLRSFLLPIVPLSGFSSAWLIKESFIVIHIIFLFRSVGRCREHFATFYIGNDIFSPRRSSRGIEERSSAQRKRRKLYVCGAKRRRRRARRRERHIKVYDVPLAYLLFEL